MYLAISQIPKTLKNSSGGQPFLGNPRISWQIWQVEIIRNSMVYNLTYKDTESTYQDTKSTCQDTKLTNWDTNNSKEKFFFTGTSPLLFGVTIKWVVIMGRWR